MILSNYERALLASLVAQQKPVSAPLPSVHDLNTPPIDWHEPADKGGEGKPHESWGVQS